MHRFPTRSTITRCRFAALLFIIRCLLPVLGFPLLAWAMLMDEPDWFIAGLGMMAAFPMVIVIQWIVASRVRCPLCFMPPLLKRGCAKNSKASPLFGSYRLKAAVSALFVGHFRCPYCGEPTVMKSRRR